jgi:hypothetical protein
MQRPANTAPASGPTITPRQARVAELLSKFYPDCNTDELAAMVPCSPTTFLRDAKALGVELLPPGKRVKYRPVERGVSCRTPGCADPNCMIRHGKCHCGCGRKTPIATRHDRQRGYIKGEPERYLRAHYDRSSEEYRRFHADKMTATMNELYADPRRKGRWAYSRHRSTREWGRANRELAAAKGRKLGPGLRHAEAVRRKAEQVRSALPGLTDDQLIDLLIDSFKRRDKKGRDTLKLDDGTRRPRRDSTYQAAGRWVERRLASVDIKPPSA